ncbi:MAG: alginate lyase family protein [Curvibacter sp.]|nr:alginate lyase family protein [Curvibacter sp.]
MPTRSMRPNVSGALSRRACLCLLGAGAAVPAWPQPAASAPPCLWPSPTQWQRLRERVAHEPAVEAVVKTLYDQVAQDWERAPQPVASLDMGLRWQGDDPPAYFAPGLRDLDRLQSLAVLHHLSGQAPYRDKALVILRAWASVNRPSGRPLDETCLEPAIYAYRLLRPQCPAADQRAVDGWLRAVARAQLDSRDLSQATAWNRVNSHRLKTVGLIGYALGDATLAGGARSGLQQQLMDDLQSDGQTLGHRQGLALEDQADDLRALLTLSLALREEAVDLYHWVTPTGASMAGSVAWLMAQPGWGGSTRRRLVQPTLDLALAWEPALAPRIEARMPGGASLRRLLSGGL